MPNTKTSNSGFDMSNVSIGTTSGGWGTIGAPYLNPNSVPPQWIFQPNTYTSVPSQLIFQSNTYTLGSTGFTIASQLVLNKKTVANLLNSITTPPSGCYFNLQILQSGILELSCSFLGVTFQVKNLNRDKYKLIKYIKSWADSKPSIKSLQIEVIDRRVRQKRITHTKP